MEPPWVNCPIKENKSVRFTHNLNIYTGNINLYDTLFVYVFFMYILSFFSTTDAVAENPQKVLLIWL